MSESELTFKIVARNPSHEWKVDHAANFASPENLKAIRDALEHRGSVVIEHWIYCGGQAPRRMVFDEYDELIEYLKKEAHAGDIVDVWSLHDLINESNKLASGKCAAEDGSVPTSGSY